MDELFQNLKSRGNEIISAADQIVRVAKARIEKEPDFKEQVIKHLDYIAAAVNRAKVEILGEDDVQ